MHVYNIQGNICINQLNLESASSGIQVFTKGLVEAWMNKTLRRVPEEVVDPFNPCTFMALLVNLNSSSLVDRSRFLFLMLSLFEILANQTLGDMRIF